MVNLIFKNKYKIKGYFRSFVEDRIYIKYWVEAVMFDGITVKLSHDETGSLTDFEDDYFYSRFWWLDLGNINEIRNSPRIYMPLIKKIIFKTYDGQQLTQDVNIGGYSFEKANESIISVGFTIDDNKYMRDYPPFNDLGSNPIGNLLPKGFYVWHSRKYDGALLLVVAKNMIKDNTIYRYPCYIYYGGIFPPTSDFNEDGRGFVTDTFRLKYFPIPTPYLWEKHGGIYIYYFLIHSGKVFYGVSRALININKPI